MSPAEGINAILVSAGVIGGSSGWASAIGMLLDEAKCVACIDSGGRGGEVKVAIDYPSVQILILGSTTQGGYAAAYAKGKDIIAALQAVPTPHASYSELVSCVQMGMIAWLGKDEKNRPRFSLNFKLITVPSSAGYRNY